MRRGREHEVQSPCEVRTHLSRASMRRGREHDDQSPWARHPAEPSPHVITMPLSLTNTLNPSPQHALKRQTRPTVNLRLEAAPRL